MFTRRNAMAAAAGCMMSGTLTPLLAQTQQQLVITTYGGRWEKFWREQLLPRLAASEQISATLDLGNSKNFAANLRAAGPARPPYSVVMMNENFSALLRSEGFFEPIPKEKVPLLDEVNPLFRNPQDNGVRAIISTIGIGYRTDMVKKPPTSWQDLWTNPEFKGKIGLYQIGATAGMLFLLLTAKIFGGSQDAIDRAFVEIKKLMPFAQVDFSGSLSTLLARGDVNVAVIDYPEIVALRQKGVPVDMVVPKEGVLAFDQSFNVTKNAPNKEAAYRYINFILRPDIQELLCREFYTSPVNPKARVPAELQREVPISGDKMNQIIQFDWAKINPQVPAIADRWNREMRT